ncbi:S-layer homology domain-containing protein [Paenibacillus sp. GCM10027628]|uniref:S-layer homology domain-containing protein n=1 Tax=Paenibacillus sp. GCM10027628 TaxID=3273413 RepID=UPI00363C49BA
MKKSLSMIAAITLALSMFGSTALADGTAANASTGSGKSSADFKDLKDLDASTKTKFDALIQAGIFDGVSSDTFGLTDEMNRAQFAKVAALIFNLKVDKDMKASSFNDVKAEDPSNGYALPYIEAVKAAGITDGIEDGVFNPAGKVTKEQLATFLVRGLGLETTAKSTNGVEDSTVSDWAKGYVALALQKGLLNNGADGKFGGQVNATRELLVVSAYNANQPSKASISSAKATGVQLIQVSLNRDVDTAKASFTVKKGTVTINTTVKWADDKKSAALTLSDNKLSAGEYTVTLGGLDATAIEQASASFTAQDEMIQKIEFVNSSDTLADAKNVVVKMKATNQYGENASLSGGSYSVIAGNNNDVNPRLIRESDGSLSLKLDTSSLTGKQENVSVIPVNVWLNEPHISVSKNFTLGVAPFVSKLELGTVKYSSGSAINKQGDTATFNINLYDQYGNVLNRDSDAYKDSNIQSIVSPYEDNLKVDQGNWDTNNSNLPQARVSLKKDIDKSGDYSIQIYYQGASAQTKISVKSAAVATKVEIGDLGNEIAAGDRDIYIPVNAYDASGNKLSLDDLVSDTNIGRIKVSVSGASYESSILNVGDHKGTIHLKDLAVNARGIISVTAYIATVNANSNSSKTYTVKPVRVPDHLKVSSEPAKYVVPSAFTTFAVQAIDQYGSSMDSSFVTDGNGNLLLGATDASSVTGNVYYYATLTPNNLTAGKTWISTDSDGAGMIGVSEDYDAAAGMATFKHVIADANGSGLKNDHFDTMNNTYRLYTSAGASGSFGFTVKLIKVGKDGKETAIDSVSRSTSVLSNNESLTYSVSSVPTLFNALSNGVIATTKYDGVTELTDTVQKDAQNGKFGKEITISAVTASGDSVATLSKQITSVTTSNTSVTKVVYSAGQAFVVGNNAGTATVVISYRSADGSIKTLSTKVTVKGDTLAVDHVTAGNGGVQTIGLSGNDAWNVMDLQVYDNYGNEFEKGDAMKYNYLFGVVFSTAHIMAVDSTRPTGRVNIDQYGNITITKADGSTPTNAAEANVSSFELTAVSANGISGTTPIKVQ